MTRSRHQLSDAATKAQKRPGRHADGGGLYLNVSPTGTKSWLFMWVRKGKRTELGLGAYPAVSLAGARSKADEYRSTVAVGGDPKAKRDKEAEPTFGVCADEYIASIKAEWRSAASRQLYVEGNSG